MRQTRYYKVKDTGIVYKLVDGTWMQVGPETVETSADLPYGPDLEDELSDEE